MTKEQIKKIVRLVETVIDKKINVNSKSILREAGGKLNILAPDLGSSVRGGRSDTAFRRAINNLKLAGFDLIDSKSKMHPANGNVNDTLIFQHPNSPKQVILHMYLGDTAKDNSFSYSLNDKPTVVSITNDKEYQESLAKYKDLSTLESILYARDKNHYAIAELKAIAKYAATKTNTKQFLNLGEKLQDDVAFNKFVEVRGCEITKNYLGSKNNIRVENNFSLKPINARQATDKMGIDVFTDGRVGYAYVNVNDKGDVEFLISELLKIPPIFK